MKLYFDMATFAHVLDQEIATIGVRNALVPGLVIQVTFFTSFSFEDFAYCACCRIWVAGLTEEQANNDLLLNIRELRLRQMSSRLHFDDKLQSLKSACMLMLHVGVVLAMAPFYYLSKCLLRIDMSDLGLYAIFLERETMDLCSHLPKVYREIATNILQV